VETFNVISFNLGHQRHVLMGLPDLNLTSLDREWEILGDFCG
jgi:hypothetical protein